MSGAAGEATPGEAAPPEGPAPEGPAAEDPAAEDPAAESPARGIADLQALEAVFTALAHQSRRTILLTLQARGGEMTSGDIAARFDHAWPTTTRHLRVLEDAGLVRVTLRGRQHVYQLDTARLRSVAGGWLARFGDPPPDPGDVW